VFSVLGGCVWVVLGGVVLELGVYMFSCVL